jgi:DNA-directed RNA polymerase subunit RPC12/RpoP
MRLYIYRCDKCGKKFILLENPARHCTYCSSSKIVKETDTDRYDLYDNKIQLLV